VTAPLQGHVDPRLAAAGDRLAAALAADPDLSFQAAAFHHGTPVLDVWGGPHLDEDSVLVPYSVSKNTIGITAGLLVERGLLDLDRPVAHYWPEFAAAGKAEITVRELLSHQAGLPATDDGIRPEDALDSRAGAERLARQRPLWRPGSGFGYHGITIGILMEELVRRITGQELQAIYDDRIRSPRDIDFYLGLPDSQAARYVDPRPAFVGDAPDPGPRDNLFAASFGPVGQAGDALLNGFGPHTPAVRRRGTAAAGGVGSARGLARLYAATLGYIGDPIAPPDTFADMGQMHVRGRDLVLDDIPLSFGVVFMKPHADMPFGSFRAYGHDGAGGAIAFADPAHGLSFGYIPTRMTIPGGVDARAIELSSLARVAAGRARRPR